MFCVTSNAWYYVEWNVWKVYENVRRCMESKDKRIKKDYNSIRSSRDISIIEGDQYIKESQSTISIASKRSISS